MNILNYSTLKEHWEKPGRQDSELPLKNWYKLFSQSDFKSHQEVRRVFAATVSIRPANRLIFNIGGNKYRLVVAVNYQFRHVYIKFIGTHSEYDQIDPDTVSRY